jgi:dolichol-phosphate mannosyltransferase
MRLAGSSFITACINWRFDVRLSESQNGFRALRTDLLRRVIPRARHTTLEQELIMRTIRLGYRIAEVPTHEHARRCGHSHISVWREAPWYVSSLVRYLFFAR